MQLFEIIINGYYLRTNAKGITLLVSECQFSDTELYLRG